MNILSIGNFTGRGWDGSITDENHIADALEMLGHHVTRHQREDPSTPLGEYDFTLISQWDGYRSDMSELPRPIVYWAFDYQADGQPWHEQLVKQSDLYLSKRIADSKYPNWQWLSQDFAPTFLRPLLGAEKDIDVLFTGSYLPWAEERNGLIELVNKHFNLEVYSVNDWPFLERKPPVMDEGLPLLYSRAKCILSIDHTIENGYWSDRNAQIIACGRKPLFRYVPLSEARFGDRVDYFITREEMMGKIKKHINHPQYEMRGQGLFVTDRVKDLLTIVDNL